MERNSAIVEPIRAHRQIDSIDREHANAVIVLHRSATRGQTNVRTMDFDKARGGASRQPSEKIHHPLSAVFSFPSCAAALAITKQRFGSRCDRHLFVVTLRLRPTHAPMRTDRNLV